MNKKKIAVIGSGISGLSISLFLSKKYDVSLFEKNKILGGHTRTINFNNDDNKTMSIDTGFIVFNDKNYPDLKSLFRYLDVETENSNMSFSVSCKHPNIEYGGSNLNSLFAQRKNLFSPRFILLVLEIIKFYKLGKTKNSNIYDQYMTIDEFLSINNFSNNLRDLHIYPMISAIWSTNNTDAKNFPLNLFIEFFKNHGLFSIAQRPQWKFVSGGSYEYVKAIVNKQLFNYFLNSKINKINRSNNQIEIIFNDGLTKKFDKIVFATHADQVINLLEDITTEELSILSNFKYTVNKGYLHSDESLMPKKKLAWSSWNFQQNLQKNSQFSLTYWMNILQNLNTKKNYFVSINPNKKPIDIIDNTIFEHPIFNINTIEAQKKLGSLQGIKNTFFCGSYCGYGFHEDGIQSAAYIAKKLNVSLPWVRDAAYKSRLNYL